MDAKIFRVNYKSDFILTLTSDAGWMTPFCIKFWTGSPMLAYYASYDGETYTHCTYDPSEPTKLTVQFDDHHLPIGNLKYQVAYHFTVADFPENTEDEVTNQANVTTVIDGDTYQVMLDLNGETAPEIQFALPAYANELQRIQNEQTRIAQEQQRIAHEQQRISQEAARVTEFNGIKAEASADHTRANEDHSRATSDHQNALADRSQAASDHSRAQSDHSTASSDHLQANSDHSRAQSDHNTALSDHQTALSDHSQANTDHTRAESDHTRAMADSSTAAADHRTASTDHTQANTDHTRAESDHQRVETDLAEVEEFSNSLGAYDISAANATGSTLATYPDLATALGPNGSNIPEALRKGGMSVKYVQTYDNNSVYVQYRLMADAFTTDTDKWAFCGDDVYVDNPEFMEVVTDAEGRILYGVKADGDFVFGVGVPGQIQERIDAEEARATQVEATKVEKVEGKGLSTEDYTTAEKGKLGALPTNADLTTALGLKANSADVYNKTAADELLVGKVDKIEGKGLSTNDYSDTDKEIVRSTSIESSNKYIDVTTDSSGKIVEAITVNGEKEINIPLSLQGNKSSIIDSNEFIEAKIDNAGNLLYGVTKEGDFVFGIGVPGKIKEWIQTVTQYSDQLRGKTVVCFGDSITENMGDDGLRYSDTIAKITGANVINVGIGGSQLRQRHDPVIDPEAGYLVSNYAALDIVNMVRSACGEMYDENTSYLELAEYAAQYIYTNMSSPKDDNRQIVKRLSDIDWNTVDAVTVFGGTNDWTAGNRTIWGETGSSDANTTLGAVNEIIRLVSSVNPNIRLYWFTPIVRWIDYSGAGSDDNNFSDVAEVDTVTLKAFSQMIFNEVTLSHIPISDLYNTLGINKYNFSRYFHDNDGTHPKDYSILAKAFIGFILTKGV